jgi:predicted nucleic acid-binding protein
MPYFTYDTSVIIARKLYDLERMPQNFMMSAIVVMELIAGAEDQSIRKFYEGVFDNIKLAIC